MVGGGTGTLGGRTTADRGERRRRNGNAGRLGCGGRVTGRDVGVGATGGGCPGMGFTGGANKVVAPEVGATLTSRCRGRRVLAVGPIPAEPDDGRSPTRPESPPSPPPAPCRDATGLPPMPKPMP